jgi:hypothetical protein
VHAQQVTDRQPGGNGRVPDDPSRQLPNGGPPQTSLANYGIVGFTRIAITDSAKHRYNFFSPYWKNDKISEYNLANGHLMQAPGTLSGTASGTGRGWGNQATTVQAIKPELADGERQWRGPVTRPAPRPPLAARR